MLVFKLILGMAPVKAENILFPIIVILSGMVTLAKRTVNRYVHLLLQDKYYVGHRKQIADVIV